MDTKALEQMLEPFGNTFIEKFEELAESQGAKNFFYYGEADRYFTYNEFNGMANCVANNLISMGLQKGDRVSLFLFNPVVTAISMFAIWKAGAVYCPINYNYKGTLLAYQINDTRPKILITEQDFIGDVNHIKSEIQSPQIILHQPGRDDHDFNPETASVQPDSMFVSTLFEELMKGNDANPGLRLQQTDTASIIYTSGTTGNPKGVLQTHRYLHNYLFSGVLLGHPDDVIYNDLPMYHVGGAFYNVVRAAWVGCQVAVWDKFSPNDFWNRINRCQANTAILLDVMVPWLMMMPESPRDRDNSLKIIHTQPLPSNHHEVARRFGIEVVTIGYGSTEAGAVFGGAIDELEDKDDIPRGVQRGHTREAFFKLCDRIGTPVVPGWEEVKKGFMGRPSFLQEIKIVGDDDQPVSPGEPGQLAIRPRLASLQLKEYFNKPAATAEALQNGWYYSGDIVVQDGNDYRFVDRIGGFIRARGENMSSHQVEGLINAHPAINNSAVFPVDAQEGSEEDIAAFIVMNQNEELSEVDLRAWMKREMPGFMIPRHIRFVTELPITPTFKVEKYKLKALINKELQARKG